MSGFELLGGSGGSVTSSSIRSFQRLIVNQNNAPNITIPIQEVNINNSLIVLRYTNSQQNILNKNSTYPVFNSSSEISLISNINLSYPAIYNVYVIEFENITVQRGIVEFGTADSTMNVQIESINPETSISIINISATGSNNNASFYAYNSTVSNENTLNIYRSVSGAGTAQIAYQVLDLGSLVG